MPLVSKTEAAKLAGVTRQTIHRKVKSGDLSAIGGEIDTSELLRVFGTLQRPLDIADQDSGNKAWATKPDPAVEVLARVDALESQLAVTREQLADTSKDRDEWREIAKEATSNVKLITNQAAVPKNNDNIAIFIAGAFALGLLTTAIYFMVLRNDVTPSDAMPLPAPVETQAAEPTPYPEGMINNYGQPCREDNPYSQDAGCPESVNYGWVKVIDQTGNVTKEWGRYAEHDPWEDDAGIDFSNLVAVPVEEAEQGANVTDSVTPELQTDTKE